MDFKKAQAQFLARDLSSITVYDMARQGAKWMSRARIYPHCFTDHSLWLTALHLTLFALHLPYDYRDKALLKHPVHPEQIRTILALFEKRIVDRLPVPYIIGEAEYLDYRFYVNPSVLVPRSLMNTRFGDFLQRVPWKNYRVLDLCTGSGCIGISLALLDPRIEVDLVDISEAAIQVARVNIQRHHLGGRVRAYQSDLFDKVQGPYDLIISNPPYVPDGEYLRQPREIRNEPALALQAGPEGLDFIEKILHQAHAYLNPQGLLIMEVGYSPARRLKKKYPCMAWEWFNFRESTQKNTWWQYFVEKVAYPDGIFLCKASDLP